MGAPPRLTADQVADARRRYAAGTATWRELAAVHQASVSAIKHAISGRTWATMTDPPPVRRQPHASPSGGTTRALTEHQVAELAGLRDEGLTWAAIGQRYSVDRSVVLRAHQQATRQHPAVQQALPAQQGTSPRRPRRNAGQPPPINDQRLSDLWVDPTLTVPEIARMIGSTPARVRERAQALNFPAKRAVRGIGLRRVIRQLWTDDSLTLADIAAAAGITKAGVSYHARAMGLDPRRA